MAGTQHKSEHDHASSGHNKEHSGHGSQGDHGNHGDHHAHMVADFKKRFYISLAITVLILLLSPMIQSFLGLGNLGFVGDQYVLFALASAIFFYGGWPFLKGIVDELKKFQPGMMTLIAVAIATAYIYSSVVVFGLAGKVFFWASRRGQRRTVQSRPAFRRPCLAPHPPRSPPVLPPHTSRSDRSSVIHDSPQTPD
ncbi:MAG: hypothetical protein R6U62_09565, partial [Bacteroidales bacterium]